MNGIIKIMIEQEYEYNGPISVKVSLNESILPGILNIEEFFFIKQQNGLVPLFTCICGDFGCGGRYINVTSTSTGLVLRNLYYPNRTLAEDFKYFLDWQQARNIAQEILASLENVRQHNPQAHVTVGYGGNNLLERLPDYRKSLLLAP